MVEHSVRNRIHPRYPVDWTAEAIVTAGGYDAGCDRIACTILNISAGGAKIAFDVMPGWLRARLDTFGRELPVTLVIPDAGAMPARVAWHRNRAIGLRFDSAFHTALAMQAREAGRHGLRPAA